jgi:hypothetical protein
MEIQATDYGFRVVDREATLTIVHHNVRDEVTRVEHKLKAELPGWTPENMPLLAAAYQGNSLWEVDVDCGAQRWHGHQSSQAVATALRRLGFNPTRIMSDARKIKGELCPHCW